jgi:hypothetical protein
MVSQMFRPFRFAFWARLAVLGLLTGEIGGGGFRGNFPGNVPKGSAPSQPGMHWPPAWHPEWFTAAHLFQIVFAVVIVAIILTLIFVYINSVLRFVLFNAVLRGDAHIIEGWRKWRDAGRRYFVWQLILAVLGWSVLISCIVVPVLSLFGDHHIGFWFIDEHAAVVLGLAFLALMFCSAVLAIVTVLAKDFVVPTMALEGMGWQDGWRRFLGVAREHASEYVLYFVMKIVLRIVAGIAQTILVVMLVVILAIPTVFLVIAGVGIGTGATLATKALLITLGIVLGLLLGVFVLAFSAFIGAPVAFFFPAYAIYFFAGRYEPLGRIVFPAPVQPVGPTIPEIPPSLA